jgi:hypothetical protein
MSLDGIGVPDKKFLLGSIVLWTEKVLDVPVRPKCTPSNP